MYTKILILSGVMVAMLAAVLWHGYRSATQPPNNNPQAFFKSGVQRSGKRVVCIGDSITHGRVSHDYVQDLNCRFYSENYTFINAGINSQLAFNVLLRLNEIIECNPDFITLMIGTNDAQATLSEKKARHYVKIMNLPRTPDPQWYRKNLTAVIDCLKKRTRAKIALLSLPPITEDVQHPGYIRAELFSGIIRQAAKIHQVSYLPVNEFFHNSLIKRDTKTVRKFVIGDNELLYTAIFYHYILGHNWDDIAQRNNLVFLTDNIHLSGKGACIVADFIEAFIRGYPIEASDL